MTTFWKLFSAGLPISFGIIAAIYLMALIFGVDAAMLISLAVAAFVALTVALGFIAKIGK